MTALDTGSEDTLALALAAPADDQSVDADQRYELVSQRFPTWLLADPVEFPPYHPTYGWACRVEGCLSALNTTPTTQLCSEHLRQLRLVKASTSLEDFISGAVPGRAQSLGWALTRKPDCRICGKNREKIAKDYCDPHFEGLTRALERGISESTWRQSQRPLPPRDDCTVPGCVHDGWMRVGPEGARHRICRGHQTQWRAWVRRVGEINDDRWWDQWLASPQTRDSVTPPSSRGQLHLEALPRGLQQELRYALHRYSSTARRSHIRPMYLQRTVDALARAGVTSLGDPAVAELAADYRRGSIERRILLTLPFAVRSLRVTEDVDRESGWFDPVIVGSSPFTSTQGDEHRRKGWDLTSVSQRWLRDILWDYLRDETLKPVGKRPVAGTVYNRITGIVVLSHTLQQNRDDHGDNPGLLNHLDAKAVKDTWDLWYREKIPIPRMSPTAPVRERTLTTASRQVFMSSIRMVLQHSRKKGRTPPAMDSFILGLPEFPARPKSPRPRPLTYGVFQTLVDSNNTAALDAVDTDDVGFADIWLTQAFQGGRISETLKLRLGCIGLVGAAQPYIWRDISKVGVIDYGMPCHLPVYERLLQRREKTLVKLRRRYRDELACLDARGRARLEATWDREMPLFPRAVQNPDLAIEVSQCGFTDSWTAWFEGLGLKGITTHQTRATLATSLLNNGAPAGLVRQLLGHFSPEALAHYANYSNNSMTRHLQQVWAAGPGMDKPGTILLRPTNLNKVDSSAAAARIDLTVVPVEHGLCRYGPVVGGANCPFEKNCTNGPRGACEHFVLTGADLAYWERKRDAAYHFAEGAPTDDARDYILSQWHDWEPVLASLRDTLDELGLLEEAEKLDLRAPIHDYFSPVFSAGWTVAELDPTARDASLEPTTGGT
jgi:integrase